MFCPSTLSLFCFFILINLFSQVMIIPVALLCIISCWTTFFDTVPKNGESIPAETLPVLNKLETFLMFPFLLPAWWLLVLVPVLILYRHHILWKTACCSPSCVLQLTIRSTICCTSFYRTSPCFFQDISPIHHNYFEYQFKHSQI